jgi:hypothetical protein
LTLSRSPAEQHRPCRATFDDKFLATGFSNSVGEVPGTLCRATTPHRGVAMPSAINIVSDHVPPVIGFTPVLEGN